MTTGSPRLYSTGFVVPERPLARSLGSGTLIKFGRLYGILTAAHVVDKLKKEKEKGLEEIGLVQPTTRPAQLQGIRVLADAIDGVQIGEKPYGEFGPDLAFIRLPDQTAGALRANSSFLNFLQEATLSNSFPPEGTKLYDFVIGVVAELGAAEPDTSKGLDMGKIVGLMNQGTTTEIAASGGYDRFKFTPSPDPNFSPPKSYGGTSGGGLWQVFAESLPGGRERLVQARLLGVAYFKSEPVNDFRIIICHGPRSIYCGMAEKIRERWKDEVEGNG